MSLHPAFRVREWWLILLMLPLLAPLGVARAAGTPAGTIIRNFATATFEDQNGNALPAVRSNEVTTVVAQVAGVVLAPRTAVNTIVGGGADIVAIQVTNIGNGPDAFDLSMTALPTGWTSVLYHDLNHNGILDANEQVPGNLITSVSLSADSTAHVLLVLTAPSTAQDHQSASVTVTATSRFNTGVKDAGTYTATVAAGVITATKSVTPTTPKPGEVVTYAIQLENTGSTTAFNLIVKDLLPTGMTFVPGSIRYGAGSTLTYGNAQAVTDANDGDIGDFGVTASNTVTVRWGNAPSGQVGIVFFRATVNDEVAAGTVINNTASITFESPSGTPAPLVTSPPASLTVQFKANPRLAIPSVTGVGEPGDSVSYHLTVTNKGNGSDILNITTQSTGGFPHVIWVDANGDSIAGNGNDFVLTDTNGDGKPDVRTLAQGDSVRLIMIVTIPPGTPNGSVDVVTVTVTSSKDPAVSVNGTVTTTAHAPAMTVMKSVSPEGSQPPGQVLTYTVVITNNGQGTAAGVVFNDSVPVHTAYVANSVTVDGSARTDASDADNVAVSGGVVAVTLGTLAPGGTRTIVFLVTIN